MPNPARKTKATPFFSCDPDRTPLFTVNPNIPVQDALNEASCFMDCVQWVLVNCAMEADGEDGRTDSRTLFALSYLTDFSKALVEACISADMKEARQ